MLRYFKNRKSNLRCTLPLQHWCSLRHTTDTQHTLCYCCGYHWDVQYVSLEFLLLIDANEKTSKGIWKKSESLLVQKLKPVFLFFVYFFRNSWMDKGGFGARGFHVHLGTVYFIKLVYLRSSMATVSCLIIVSASLVKSPLRQCSD